MAPDTTDTADTTPPPGSRPDWTTKAADAIERTVATVRDRTVVPAQQATRAVVYGLLVFFFVITAFTLLTIGLFRLLVVLTGEAWIAYLIVGGIFVIAGTFCWTLRTKRAKPEEEHE